MEDNFNQNDFEGFLQDQVRNHRMYPSDAVWREIDKKLNGEKRWPALTFTASMLVSTTVLICVYFSPKPNIFAIQPSNVNTSTQHSSPKNNILNTLTASAPFGQDKVAHKGPVERAFTAATVDFNNPQAASDAVVQDVPDIVTENNRSVAPVHVSNLAVAKTSMHVNASPVNNVAPGFKQKGAAVSLIQQNPSGQKVLSDEEISRNQEKVAVPEVKVNSVKNIGSSLAKETGVSPVRLRLKDLRVKNKFSYQLYIAPSVSYRNLLEDYSIIKENNGGPVALNYVADVNKVVRHKPGTGIEVGVSFMYNVTNTVRIKSGFQFNMRQYSIEAYKSATELASIALLRNNRIDTVNTLTYYRNSNGYSSTELVNRYFQLSMPLGVEWQVIGNSKIQLNIAGTIQPTYLLNRNAYLLSTNFKNYAESPAMIRQWNLNSNIEAFISVKAGDLKLQLGPQLRYQPYSTFIPQYPIKEHLMDYGVKFGVSRILY